MSRLVDRDKVLVDHPAPASAASSRPSRRSSTRASRPSINSYCSAKPGLSAMSKWAFRNTLTSDKQLKPVVDAWLKEYKIKKVVIIYDAEDAVSKGEGAAVLPKLFKEHGIEMLDSLTYRTKDTDYSAQVTKAKSLGAEGIALGACYQNAAAIAKEMAKQGLNVPIIGGACAGAPGYIEIAGKAAEGTYMSTAAWLDDPRPEVQAYVKKIKPQAQRPAAALQRPALLRHHLLVQILHREVRHHQQAGRSRQRPRQDPSSASARSRISRALPARSPWTRCATAPASARSSRWSTESTSTSPSKRAITRARRRPARGRRFHSFRRAQDPCLRTSAICAGIAVRKRARMTRVATELVWPVD